MTQASAWKWNDDRVTNFETSTQRKIVIDIADRGDARTYAAALTDLLIPAPDALTLFEQGTAWRIEAYYDPLPEPATLAVELSTVCGLSVPVVRIEDVPPENWVLLSQAALPPVIAGRFTVHGSHDRHRVPRGPNSILIDAGEAFGTAHHATTQGCLAAIDRLTRRHLYSNVLDLGCGSGVLAIAVARALPHARIIASDVDAQSVVVARSNMRDNGVAARIRCVAASGLGHPALRARVPYDLIVANILAAPLIMLAPKLAAAARPGTHVVLSGLLVPQAAEVSAAYVASGFELQRHDRIVGWATLTLAKR